MSKQIKKEFIVIALKLLKAAKEQNGEEAIKNLDVDIPDWDVDEVVDRLDEALEDLKGEVSLI